MEGDLCSQRRLRCRAGRTCGLRRICRCRGLWPALPREPRFAHAPKSPRTVECTRYGELLRRRRTRLYRLSGVGQERNLIEAYATCTTEQTVARAFAGAPLTSRQPNVKEHG